DTDEHEIWKRFDEARHFVRATARPMLEQDEGKIAQKNGDHVLVAGYPDDLDSEELLRRITAAVQPCAVLCTRGARSVWTGPGDECGRTGSGNECGYVERCGRYLEPAGNGGRGGGRSSSDLRRHLPPGRR